MADNKKMVEAITSMDTDFAQWYTDVVKKAELCDYASVKGCMVIKPAGYAIWENIQKMCIRDRDSFSLSQKDPDILFPPGSL